MRNYSAASWREQVTFKSDDNNVRFVLEHHVVVFLKC